MGLLREQCAEWRKGHMRYCCNQVWMKNGGRIPWSTAAICETFKISCLMGKTPYETRFGMPFNGPVIPFGAMVEYHLFLLKTYRDCINLVLKSCQVFSLDVRCTRRGIWKGDILVADIEELEQMDASEIYAKRTQCKGSVFPNYRWNSKTFSKRSGSENIHLYPG